MSIFKAISELNALKKQIDSFNVEANLNPKTERQIKSYSTKVELLSDKIEHLDISTDLMADRIKEIYTKLTTQEVAFSTPPSTPVKTEVPLPKKGFGTPTRLVLEKASTQRLNVNIGITLNNNLGEILESPDYVNRIINLQEKLDQLSEKLQKLIAVEKESMIKTIMENQPKDNRPFVQQSVDEFFDFISEQESVFENVVMALQKAHPTNKATILKNLLADQENPLFRKLGNVATSPEYFFEFNETAKALSENFMKNLYEDPKRKAVISSFQKQKRQGLRIGSLNKILTKELLDECRLLDKYVLYNEHAKEYITAPLSESELDDLTLVKLDDNNLADVIESLSHKKNMQYANLIQQEIYRNFEELPLDANIEGCISFFPIKTIEKEGKEKYTCLVTTSGEISKIKGDRSKVELANLQTMLTSFASGLQTFEGYNFVYYGKEHPGMDFVLGQMNKGFSGTEKLNENQGDFDPDRGCAEKKFIAFLRNLMFQQTQFEVLGSANRRVPLVNVDASLETTKPQDEKMTVNAKLDIDFYQSLLTEVKNNGCTVEGQTKIRELVKEGYKIEEFNNAILDKAGKLYNIDKLPVKKQLDPLIKQLNTKITSFSAISVAQNPKNKSDALGTTNAPVTSDFIPCCTSCQAIKIPTLTLLEIYRGVRDKKQTLSVKLPIPVLPQVFVERGVLSPRSPTVTFRTKSSPERESHSTLTPGIKSLSCVSKEKAEDKKGQRSLDFS